jgi:hypothetical protein
MNQSNSLVTIVVRDYDEAPRSIDQLPTPIPPILHRRVPSRFTMSPLAKCH